MNSVLSLLATAQKDTPKAVPDLEESLRVAARTMQRSLGSRAGGDFRVRTRGIRIQPLRMFMEENRPKEPSIFVTFNNGATAQPGLILFSGKLLSRIMGCMLGDGEESGMYYRAKHPITDLEMRVGRRVAQDLLSGLNSHWPDPTGTRFRLIQASTHARFITPELREDDCIGCRIEISSGDIDFGGLLITVPLPENLSPMRSHGQDDQGARDAAVRQRERAMDMHVQVSAELARVSLTLGELRKLAVGDIIPLGPSSNATLCVHDKPVLKAEPGQSDGYRSVRIIEKLG
jgi:flagellar motor switch protein FliM